MNNIISLEDKIDYVAAELYSNSKRFRVVTIRAIETVLDNPPQDVRVIRSRELKKINDNLIVPLVAETVQEIVRIANEYDRIVTDNVAKPVKRAHELIAINPHPQGKLCFNL